MAVSVPLSPRSPPNLPSSPLLHNHPSLSHPRFLHPLPLPSTLPSATLSFPFCVHLVVPLPLPPSLSLTHTPTSRFCIRVPIAVESLSGLAERRFRRHDNEPRKPSHSLPPSFLPPTSPRLHRFSPPLRVSPPRSTAAVSTCYSRLCPCFCACPSLTWLYARLQNLRMQERTSVCVCAQTSTLQTAAARFIHLLHVLLPGCCTPAQPSLAEGGRCTQPCATPGRMCVLEERDPPRCLTLLAPDGNIERPG